MEGSTRKLESWRKRLAPFQASCAEQATYFALLAGSWHDLCILWASTEVNFNCLLLLIVLCIARDHSASVTLKAISTTGYQCHKAAGRNSVTSSVWFCTSISAALCEWVLEEPMSY